MSNRTFDREAVTAEARAKWQSDPQLRAEFCDDVDIYVAWCIADAQRRVRILGRDREGERQ